MAINNYGGFADGFKDGFGLVNDVIDRKNKQNNVEDAAKTQKTQFGLTLDQQKAEAQATADYRLKDLSAKQINQEAINQSRKVTDETAQISAGTSRINAVTAAKKAADLLDPESNAYKKEEAELKGLEAKNKEDLRVNAVKTKQQLNQDSAVRLDALVKAIDQSDGMYSDALYEEAMKTMELNEGSDFSVNYLGSDEAVEDTEVVNKFMTGMSLGDEVEADPAVLNALGNVLQLNKTVNVGKTIDTEFVNAPMGMRAGGDFGEFKIVSQGLFALGNRTPAPVNGIAQPAAVGGTLYVMTENSKGEMIPYFPPLTSGRSMANGAPLTLEVNPTLSALAGKAYLVQQVGGKIKPLVKRAAIKSNYGNNAGSNGVDEYNKEVDRRMDQNIKGLQGGSTNIFMGSNTGLTNEQQLRPAELAKMRGRVQEELLFGVRKQPEQERVMEWLAAEESALKGFRVKGTKGRAEKTLGEIIPVDAWNPQLISALSTQIGEGEPDKDGAATSRLIDPSEFLKQMTALNLKSAMEF